ncbi:hypothetical protein FE257_010386 [Aspergillus nanangensis]|uniref:Carrier domain-containing protein n=1 Tax=Aspergillus nanangensis TaxID=2582783 RepID=A0AAD4CJB0_ASPNN|nr:hypothetical protein FE257_010386 [Aspergillus nanangensis]
MPGISADPVVPIAIVGIGGRFPGDASNPDRLWDLLVKRRSALSDTPKDRFNVDAFYHPQGDRPGSQNFRGGHFMERPIDAFDAPFFSITPAEAKAMDPQQRMCLEVAYEAIENAGVALDRVSGSSTSCYVGCFNHDYANLVNRDPETTPFYNATGTEASCLSNRVSWFFNLAGPSMTVDTACSSSLVALHLACQSIRSGESSMALVGGVNIISSTEMNTQLSTLQMISVDSKSQTFDAKANGYGRGEGTCFVVIKSLEDAIKDDDVIRAVIRNTGSNQDGNTPGLTLPSRNMQEALIRKVYDEAGLRLEDTGYFEAHGTGTVAGDSTETRALGETIGKSRPVAQPLWIGSIKASIGHLEGASGLAALIKTVYVLEKGIIPPQVWFENINPRIRLKEWNLAVPTEVTPWPYPGPRRASVNSFGFAGANAHAVLEDAYSYLAAKECRGRHNSRAVESTVPSPTRSDESNDSGLGGSRGDNGTHEKTSPKLIVWSSHEQSGLKRISQTWKDYLEDKSQNLSVAEQTAVLDNLAYTATRGRSRFPWRSFTVCSSPTEIVTSTADIAPPFRTSQKPKLAFVFTGQGAQHFAMGRSLMKYKTYADCMQNADSFLQSLGCKWSLLEELSRDEISSRVNPAEFSQPLCIALQVALVDLLRSLEIWPPEAVIGHSGGETAAAYAKGALSREDAWTVAYYRGQVCSKLPEINPDLDGDMLAAAISEKEAEDYIKMVSSGELVVACVNSSSSVTLSGDVPAIIEAEKLIKADGHLAKKLGVNQAYHSSHMQAVGDMYQDMLKNVHGQPETPDSPKMFSCVTGDLIANSDLGGTYWVTNLLSQVKFAQAMQALTTYSNNKRTTRPKGYCYVNVMLEVGPHGALQGPVKQCLKGLGAQCTTISVLDRKKDATRSLLESLGVLFQHGYEGDLIAANFPEQGIKPKLLVDLPPYPWNHSSRYWHESARISGYRFKKFPRKDLLGIRDDNNNDQQASWRQFLRLSENPWMEDHQIQGRVIYPAAGMLTMALEGARELANPERQVESFELRNVSINKPILIPSGEEGVETMLHMQALHLGVSTSTAADWREFSIYSRLQNNPWAQNCTGSARIHYKAEPHLSTFVDESEQQNARYRDEYTQACDACHQPISSEAFYADQTAVGIHFGETFQNVEDIRKGESGLVCTVRTPDVASKMPHNFTHEHLIHPCTLDPIIHSCLALPNDSDSTKGPAVPTSIKRLLISTDIPRNPGNPIRVHSSAKQRSLRDAEVSICASCPDWEKPLVILDEVKVTRLGGNSHAQDGADQGLRKIASKLVWGQDISFHDLTADAQNNDIMSLEDYIRLLGHKYPDLDILEVGAGHGDMTAMFLNALAGHGDDATPWLQTYTATEEHNDQLNTLKQDFQSWGHYFKGSLLTPSENWKEQGFGEGSHHCIVVNIKGEESGIISTLGNAKTSLKEDGVLILNMSHKLEDSITTWSEHLSNHGFTIIRSASSDSATPPIRYIAASVNTSANHAIVNDILLVGPCHETPLSNSLKEQFEHVGINVRSTTLRDTESLDMAGVHCVMISDLEHAMLFDIDPKSFLIVKRLLLESQSTLWVTSGATSECSNPKAALVTGLLRSVHNEHPEISMTTLDVNPSEENPHASAKGILEVFRSRLGGNIDKEFAIRGGRILTPRLDLDDKLNKLSSVIRDGPRPELGPLKQDGRALTLSLEVPKVFDSIFFKDDHNAQELLDPNSVEVEIKATGLNAIDVLSGMDEANEAEPTFGRECSGIVRRVGGGVTKFTRGDRVMGWCQSGFGNFTRIPQCLVQHMPIGMSFEMAASIPINYCTAYQALVASAHLQRGERVLIHCAAGGVGQAAIMIAQNIGAEVYVTVGSEEKKAHLLETYGILDNHVFNSRDLSFAQGIRRLAIGVDVVLNCLSGEGAELSWSCLAPFGRFVDIRQIATGDIASHGTGQVAQNVSYYSIDIFGLRKMFPSHASTLFEDAMRFYYVNNCQPASPLHVMGFSEIADGLRSLQNGKQTGKIVCKAKDNDLVMAMPPPLQPVEFNDGVTYIIVGGFGGLGQHIAMWMVEHGARNLVFLSRSGADSLEAKKILREIHEKGAHAVGYKCDISNLQLVEQTMNDVADQWPPVRGVVQAAMSLADATFKEMTPKQWDISTRTKAVGTWNLHCTAPKDLDFFVMLSSISGIIGLRGQANYAAGNSFMDALAHHRRSRGLAASSLDVGAVFDVGYMAQKSEMKETMRSLGFIGLKGDELLGMLQEAMSNPKSGGGDSTAAQVILGLATSGYLASENVDIPYYFSDPKMSRLKQIGASSHDQSNTGPGLAEQLSKATTRSSAAEFVSNALRARLAKQMMVDIEDVDPSKPVSGYGVDSLTAVDIRSWGLKEAQADVSILDIVNNVSIMSLAEGIVSKSGLMANKRFEDKA